jgi:hypothetical protein
MFISDTSKRKALFCPRRAGKSYALGIYLIQESLKYPGRKNLYIGLTKNSSLNAMWSDIILKELKKHQIFFLFNEHKKQVQFSNNSTITFAGIDCGPQEMKKILGGKYHLAVIDECQDHRQNIKEAIIRILEPAMADYLTSGGGIICLAGTPGIHMGKDDYWFQVTKQTENGLPDLDREPGWTVHSWGLPDNPMMIKQFAIACDEKFKLNPDYQSDPNFRREWLGQWVLDIGSHVYKFDSDKNILHAFTPDQLLIKQSLLSASTEYTYLIGVDLGWEDATAIVIAAYSKFDRHCYIVESTKFNHALTDVIGAVLLSFNNKYRPQKILVDTAGGSKIVAQDMMARFNLPIFPAEKVGVGKAAFVGRMNSDFLSSLIQIIPETNQELIKEYDTLLLDSKKVSNGSWGELASCDNHLCDAALYAYKDAWHYFSTAQVKQPTDLASHLIQRRKQTKPIFFNNEEDIYFNELQELNDCKDIINRFRSGDNDLNFDVSINFNDDRKW